MQLPEGGTPIFQSQALFCVLFQKDPTLRRALIDDIIEAAVILDSSYYKAQL